MRTTVTLDDDLAKELKDEARRRGVSFKEIVNEALRRGLKAGAVQASRPKRFRVRPRACGFQPGIDPRKLNQLFDEMEIH
ncbi:MAG TPA: CopG family transcriptional regulator [Thermoanaerobaculia bacterium]|nr:CopG family transcriptional regulator [Thermoanaerobaculia bacterium]